MDLQWYHYFLGACAFVAVVAILLVFLRGWWRIQRKQRPEPLVILIKAYRSSFECEDGVAPLAVERVTTVGEFDAAVEKHSFPARYLSFESARNGVMFSSQTAARHVLANPL